MAHESGHDELSTAIAGFRRARRAEQGRAFGGALSAAGAAQGGARLDQAIAAGQAAVAGAEPVAVGGQAGLTPQERLQAQFKVAELQTGIAQLNQKHAQEVWKSTRQKKNEQLAEAVKLMTAAAEFESANIAQFNETQRAKLGSQVDALGLLINTTTAGAAGAGGGAPSVLASTVPTAVDVQAASDWVSGNFGDPLKQGNKQGIVATEEFWVGLNAELEGKTPQERARFVSSITNEVNFPVDLVLGGADLTAMMRSLNMPGAQGAAAIAGIVQNMQGAHAATEQLLVQADAQVDQIQTQVEEISARIAEIKGGGSNDTANALMQAGLSLLKGDATQAQSLVAAAPRIDALEGIDIPGAPAPQPPLRRAFDLKQKIMGSELFKQRVGDQDPDEFFNTQMREVGQAARQKIASKLGFRKEDKPEEPEGADGNTHNSSHKAPTRTGVPYNVEDITR